MPAPKVYHKPIRLQTLGCCIDDRRECRDWAHPCLLGHCRGRQSLAQILPVHESDDLTFGIVKCNRLPAW